MSTLPQDLTCTWVRERLTAWLDGELPPNDEAILRQHVQNCPDCDHLYQELMALAELTATWQGQSTEQDLWPRVYERICQEPEMTNPSHESEMLTLLQSLLGEMTAMRGEMSVLRREVSELRRQLAASPSLASPYSRSATGQPLLPYASSGESSPLIS